MRGITWEYSYPGNDEDAGDGGLVLRACERCGYGKWYYPLDYVLPAFQPTFLEEAQREVEALVGELRQLGRPDGTVGDSGSDSPG